MFSNSINPKVIALLSLGLFSVSSIYSEEATSSESKPIQVLKDESNEKIKAFDFSEENLMSLLEHEDAISITSTHNSELLVLNFWATWCSPCVKELPYFEALDEAYKDKGVKVVGYSLDYDFNPDDWKEVSQATLDRREVDFANFVLDVQSNETFPHFSKNWVGNLPATFIFNKEGKLVKEILHAVEQDVLLETVEELLLEEAKKNVFTSGSLSKETVVEDFEYRF